MADQKFPYQAWLLRPSCTIEEVTVCGAAYGGGWFKVRTSRNVKTTRADSLFPSRNEAIAGGHMLLRQQEARLAKSGRLLAQRQARLAKAEEQNG